MSQPLAPQPRPGEGGDAAAGGAGRRAPGRGGRGFGGTPSPTPFWPQGLGPFRPASAPLGSRPLRPSLALSLPPARDCPRAQRGELAVAGRARRERSGSPGQPSSPPRAWSQLNFSEVSKGLPGSPAGDSCTDPRLRWTRLRLFQPAGGSMPRPGMEASVAPGARARASREESRGARHAGGSGAGVPVRGRGPGRDGGGRVARVGSASLSSPGEVGESRGARQGASRANLVVWGLAGSPRGRRSLSRGCPRT